MKLVALLVILAACDPKFTMEGDVHDADGKPVAGARVALVCDGTEPHHTVSNASGQFHDDGVGWFPLTCNVEVTPAGRPTVSFPVKEHCTKLRHDDACLTITLHAQLRR